MIGRISETVSDIAGTELRVDQPVSARVEVQLRKQLSAAGLRVVESGPADYVASGAVREMRLDVAARDELSLSIETRFVDAAGMVTWAGVVDEKTDRYAGVSGNSRASILRFLDDGLSKVSAKAVNELIATLRRARPEAFATEAQVARSAAGVTVLTQAAPAASAPTAASSSTATGRLSVRTDPPRAKVIVDDVYQGLSPLDIDLPAGVHALLIRLSGFQDSIEKVAIRKDQATEYEVNLQR